MIVTLDNGHLAIEGGYWNANGFAVAIVALVNPGIDWSAYIGGTPGSEGWTEEDTIRWVARHGCKLLRETALHFFAFDRIRDVMLKDMEYRP